MAILFEFQFLNLSENCTIIYSDKTIRKKYFKDTKTNYRENKMKVAQFWSFEKNGKPPC